MTAAHAFDDMAADYDGAFTDSLIGRRMRNAVWRRCDPLFPAGSRLLDMNCGTGEDAVHFGGLGIQVVATDASTAMLSVARGKVAAAGLQGMVQVEHVRIEDIDPSLGMFDNVLSNFGGLNCVSDLWSAASRLASVVRTGGHAVLCVMGPCVPWEWAWFVLRGKPRRAVRRLQRGGTTWRDLTIRYPAIGDLRRAFAPAFRATRVAAVGALLPPPFTEAWACRHPRVVDALDRLERAAETTWPLPWLADHYVIELKREPA